MAKYRKKPVVIDAIEATSMAQVGDWLRLHRIEVPWSMDNEGVHIKTLEGTMLANWGDFIIRGVKGEFYPCKPDIFEQTYEAVE